MLRAYFPQIRRSVGHSVKSVRLRPNVRKLISGSDLAPSPSFSGLGIIFTPSLHAWCAHKLMAQHPYTPCPPLRLKTHISSMTVGGQFTSSSWILSVSPSITLPPPPPLLQLSGCHGHNLCHPTRSPHPVPRTHSTWCLLRPAVLYGSPQGPKKGHLGHWSDQ